ncbi:hypothetical protein PIB30_023140 [Stylosanthes scabra]|uniref:Transposase (Putative), gypsy type n=1 Tax=Stylosanthes scabra TaxID=79078 RepID=A0ABU6R9Y7_9FABA|nr:hypothetical protein [Stylosanthes scabra]
MAVNRETDENGKPLVTVDGNYSWVKGEVRDLVSLFIDVGSVEQIGDPSLYVHEGSDVRLRFLPCEEKERVYFCAPTRIHPNGWAFIRGFEILMEYLGTRPLLESYKDFKQMFIKVGCVEEQFPFYLDEFGLERFPLYWYSEPVQILGMDKISRESARMVKFMEEFVEKTEVLSLNMLFKWEKEREYVERYLETTTGGLKNFFKSRAERGHPASNVVKTEEGGVVNKPAESRRVPSMKRRRAEAGGSDKEKVIDLTSNRCCGKEVSLDEVKRCTERQRPLHGYVGEEDLTSVWSEHFPMSVVAEEHFQSKMDLELLGSMDDKTRAQFMQVCAARLLCLGRFEELKANKLEKELEAAREQNNLKDKEMLELKSTVEGLKGKLQKFEKEKTEFEARVVELCVEKKEAEQSKEDHGYDMMAAGFERARKQAEFLYPDIKFDNLDPVKVVHNGALVDDDEVDLEGGDDHNPGEGGV